MTRLFITLAVLVSAILSAGQAFAVDSYEPLTAAQMNKLLPGNTIKGEYRYLRERTKTFNFREAHHDDGTTSYIEGPVKETGRWYTLGDRKICYKYPDNPQMGISCFWVYENTESKSQCYYGYGVANMTLKGPRNYDNWTARWVIEGSGGTCNEPIS